MYRPFTKEELKIIDKLDKAIKANNESIIISVKVTKNDKR